MSEAIPPLPNTPSSRGAKLKHRDFSFICMYDCICVCIYVCVIVCMYVGFYLLFYDSLRPYTVQILNHLPGSFTVSLTQANQARVPNS
jgi:hypothetical protein